MVPVEYDDQGNILDGHHRVRACEELGITEWPRFVRKGLSEPEKRQHARQLNLARRHLSREHKRSLIGQQLRETPEKSNRQVAEGLGVSHVTVGTVRDELEATGQVDQLEKTVGADGKARRKPIRQITTEYAPGHYNGIERNRPVRLLEARPFVTNNSGKNEWYTTGYIIEAAREVLGTIEFDPASSSSWVIQKLTW